MPTLPIKVSNSTPHFFANEYPETFTAEASQALMGRHACPCCSYVLLRHISMSGVYWHCSHCHQTMPT